MTQIKSEKADAPIDVKGFPHKELTAETIGSFYTVYNEFGYGFLESPYANALPLELCGRGLRVRREVPVEILYRGQPVGLYRMDMVVEDVLLIEIKSTASIGEAGESLRSE